MITLCKTRLKACVNKRLGRIIETWK